MPNAAPQIAPLAPPPGFVERVGALGVEFEPSDLERLGRFLALLLHANETTNLTAITDPAQAWDRHILDALALVPVIASVSPQPAAAGAETTHLSVADVGSGGGVPAIPLAIVMPDVRFTLVEATGKKAAFLERTIATLGLTNARVLNARAEAIGQDHRSHREKYDVAMARALGHLAIVAELCAPLVRQHGVVIAVKGAKAAQEVEEAGPALGMVGLRHVETLDTPTGRLVVMEKTIRTPRLYPRRDGEPSRVPLGIKRARK
jgi:16S rRNA (guanine527-N7)-methyltransferase